ncbi:hypothetical protein K435DRAFT_798485 [Dendrothele bispora CBS 962.96]|uniref:Cytosol aminopeptidase domain-containing protein n=1 Tax=Dendrothele bispora (strain CBS 962.96) TaxID=1314807 RepID=A0A4S8LZ24_DENBC|nr:hypothetical protein K435DRAFT_798485 [Dendrothele bispora CBS 962.96]
MLRQNLGLAVSSQGEKGKPKVPKAGTTKIFYKPPQSKITAIFVFGSLWIRGEEGKREEEAGKEECQECCQSPNLKEPIPERIALKPKQGSKEWEEANRTTGKHNDTYHTFPVLQSLVVCTPLMENMPGPSATKPGDIVYAMNGKSVEVDNTFTIPRGIIRRNMGGTSPSSQSSNLNQILDGDA